MSTHGKGYMSAQHIVSLLYMSASDEFIITFYFTRKSINKINCLTFKYISVEIGEAIVDRFDDSSINFGYPLKMIQVSQSNSNNFSL